MERMMENKAEDRYKDPMTGRVMTREEYLNYLYAETFQRTGRYFDTGYIRKRSRTEEYK